nr:hypothetical protein [Tanacetum cinerariifolium]
KPASPVRDVNEGETCPTDSGFIADQDRATLRVTCQVSSSKDDAPIKGRRIDEEEGITGRVSSDTEEIRIDEGEVAVKRTSEDTEEMATVLTSMDAATVLAGRIDVPTGTYSISTAGPLKGKEVMVESDTPKKQRLQEQIDAQVARELEEQQEREDKRMTKQIARDAEVARIHAEEELQGMINSLDRTNDVGNKMHKAFPLLEESSHWQYKFPLPVEGVPTARRIEIPLPGVCTAMMQKLPVKENWQLH